MYSKLRVFLLLLMGFSMSAAAQEKGTALVKGKLQNEASGQPANDVQLTIPFLKLLASSDGEGNFSFSQVPYGTHTLVINTSGYRADSIRIMVGKEVVDLGVIDVTPNESAISMQSIQIPTIALENNDVNSDDEGSSTQSVSGLLTAGRDPFLNAAAFVFGSYWFKTRGYERNQQQIQINGAPMNDVETNDAFWGQWGGLNDVFRGRSSTYGLQPSEYAFGGINGNVYFDASAANQRKQTRVTYSLSNRQYRNRLMVTHSSGMLKDGWAYSLSASKRWAKEGYIEGTFYDSYSYYAAVSKRINAKHELNLITFGAPTRRGKNAPSYGEANEILGNNFYNPNWGYQNGEKRNSRVADVFQPVFLLSHELTASPKTHLTTTLAYQFGKNANSTLDWYNAPDPRPDYYKNLPSYYIFDEQPNLGAAQANFNSFTSDPQLNWDALYQANYMNMRPIPNPDGSLSADSARRSLYVLGNDVDDVKKWIFNTNLQHVLNDHITLYTGVSFINQKTESYRELLDLLGGDYFLNVNSFTERNIAGTTTFNQNDLDNANKLLKVGDKYYYDYNAYFQKAWPILQNDGSNVLYTALFINSWGTVLFAQK
ncbi:MAG: TonB-dependent receptor, partial [Sphingobacteriales bacterium]